MHIDGIPIEREVTPSSELELAQIMASAWEAGTTMVPVGRGTKLHLGNPPLSAQLAVHTRQLRGIVEYEADNMTVSILAGTSLQELQEVLRTHNQFLPLDPPQAEQATIGGLVASNVSGALRFRYGTIRDMLIGARIVHANGTQTKAGGKLVKNVSGYDMCKLYTGSLGTLGILSELTFKVQPRSETLATIVLAYPSFKSAHEATQVILRSELLPDAMEAWNTLATQPLAPPSSAPWILMIRFGEFSAAVEWQVNKLKRVIPETGGEILRIMETEESERFWQQAASAREPSPDGEEVLLKCSVLYQSMVNTVRLMEELGERLGARTCLFCHAGTYVIYGSYRWAEKTVATNDDLHQGLMALRQNCTSLGGHVVVEKVRTDIKKSMDVWGYQSPALEIMKKIKKAFDPKGLLNPGRFVGGI